PDLWSGLGPSVRRPGKLRSIGWQIYTEPVGAQWA
ncbi:hypothetical protein ATR1_078c0001, partial [Acetobacter tropicalis]